MKSAWESVSSWVSGAVKGIKDSVSGAVSWVKSRVSGSHRTGLNYVPYDGYIAELHKGEQVLTAAEANQYDMLMKNLTKVQDSNKGADKQTIINLNGDYMFQDKESMDYFMNRLGLVLARA